MMLLATTRITLDCEMECERSAGFHSAIPFDLPIQPRGATWNPTTQMDCANGSALSRRAMLRAVLGAISAPLLPAQMWAEPADGEAVSCLAAAPQPTSLTPEDDPFLEELERANCLFFVEQANPQTGLVRDRCNVRTLATNKAVGSIAATGFGLTALCIAHQRGFIPLFEASARVLAALHSLWKLPVHHGLFYHWVDINTGQRTWNSEVSSIDSAILLCGILTCRQHFQHDEISTLAHQIFNRVDWSWLAEDTPLLSHGWSPEIGFIPSRWDYYSELMAMYLLGLGSYSHPLRPDT
jgi:hypothetical protein